MNSKYSVGSLTENLEMSSLNDTKLSMKSQGCKFLCSRISKNLYKKNDNIRILKQLRPKKVTNKSQSIRKFSADSRSVQCILNPIAIKACLLSRGFIKHLEQPNKKCTEKVNNSLSKFEKPFLNLLGSAFTPTLKSIDKSIHKITFDEECCKNWKSRSYSNSSSGFHESDIPATIYEDINDIMNVKKKQHKIISDINNGHDTKSPKPITIHQNVCYSILKNSHKCPSVCDEKCTFCMRCSQCSCSNISSRASSVDSISSSLCCSCTSCFNDNEMESISLSAIENQDRCIIIQPHAYDYKNESICKCHLLSTNSEKPRVKFLPFDCVDLSFRQLKMKSSPNSVNRTAYFIDIDIKQIEIN